MLAVLNDHKYLWNDARASSVAPSTPKPAAGSKRTLESEDAPTPTAKAQKRAKAKARKKELMVQAKGVSRRSACWWANHTGQEQATLASKKPIPAERDPSLLWRKGGSASACNHYEKTCPSYWHIPVGTFVNASAHACA